MSSITFTEISGTDMVSNLPATFNNNFTIAKEAINDLISIVDIDTNQIAGLEKLTITKAGAALTTTGLDVAMSAEIDGNITCGGDITANNLTLQQTTGLTITTGNLDLQSSSSSATFGGKVEIGTELVLNTFGDAQFLAAHTTAYGSVDGTTGILLTDSFSGKILDFSDYDGVNYPIASVRLSTPNTTTVGRIITLVFLLNANAVNANSGNGIILEKSTTLYSSSTWGTTMDNGIKINKSGVALTLVYLGSDAGWLLIDTNGTLLDGITIY